MTTAAIACRDLTVALGGRPVLDHLSLDVAAGEWMAVVGPNGAGKSTLVRALAGVTRFEGTVRVGGQDVASLGARARARLLAVVPQDPLVPPALRVVDYALLGRTAHIRTFGVESAADLAVGEGVLDRLNLRPLAGRPMGTLSGGERQRAVLARALAQEAPVLLLDEPTTSLDVGRQQEVLDLVEDLRRARGLTVLSTLHDLTLAGQYARRMALLVEGRIVSFGRPEEVLTEERVSRHYGARVRVVHDAGSVVVLPHRGPRDGSAGGQRVAGFGDQLQLGREALDLHLAVDHLDRDPAAGEGDAVDSQAPDGLRERRRQPDLAPGHPRVEAQQCAQEEQR
jgi:iron complex transport system ATP-binding protein